MNLKRYIIIIICIIIIIQPIVSNSIETENTNNITNISDLNKKTAIDSHKDDIENSRLELNYRDVQLLDFSGVTFKEDTKEEPLEHINYPRLKILKEDEEGYKYLLTFQKCYSYYKTEEDKISNKLSFKSNGDVIYYTRSKDLKEWELPQILFGTNNDIRNFNFIVLNEQSESKKLSTKLYYTSCDSYVLNDGRIMAICAGMRVSGYSDYLGLINKCGLYVKYSSDNGKSWSEEEQIYKGICYEPSILQLENGEIQVYFTHEAHIMYMNGEYDTKYPNSLVSKSSAQGQSTGIGMLSSADYGNTWTPDVKGIEGNGVDETKYNKNISNPYSAYVISQQTIKENYNKLFNYANPFVWIGETKSWKEHRGISVDNNTIIKMGNQMPVAVRLNNGKLAMAMETRETNVEYIENDEGEYIKNSNGKYVRDDVSNNGTKYKKVVNGFFNISLGYSKQTPVYMQDGDLIYKYWLDLKKEQENTIKVYSNEDDIYSGVGLGGGNGVSIVKGNENNQEGHKFYEEGPKEKVEHVFINDTSSDNKTESRAAPYIAQFPSGETVLSYTNNGTKINLGDSEGKFTYLDGSLINKNVISLSAGTWSSIERTSSHCVEAVIAKMKNNVRKIQINPLYLNHTITAEPLTIEKNEMKWNDNTDALFIGSDSQAQVAIRLAYDKDNIYVLLERLDKKLYNYDDIELFLSTDSIYKVFLQYNPEEKECNSFLVKNSTNEVLNSISYIVDSSTETNEEKFGYKTIICIPKEKINGFGSSLRLNAKLYNNDNEKNTNAKIIDGFNTIDEDNVQTWNKVKFVEKVESINLNKQKQSLIKGNSAKINAQINVENNYENTEDFVTWSSSNPTIATVDSNGNVTGNEIGNATIYLTSSNGKFAQCDVEVKNDIVEITMNKLPKTEYQEREDLDLTNGVLDVKYQNSEIKQLPLINESGDISVKISGYNKDLLGKQIVTLTYMGKSCTFEITVKGKTLTGIEVTKEPNKKTYVEGESFETEGMKVTATYDNGTRKEVTEYTVTDGSNLTEGKKTVTISYTENEVSKTTTQAITVNKLLKIEIDDIYENVEIEDSKYIENIKPKTSIKELLSTIKTNGNIEIYKGMQNIEDMNTKLSTGMRVKVSLDNQMMEYVIVVTGDLDGDGEIGNVDLLKLARYRAGLDTNIEGEYLQAANIFRDDNLGDDIDLLKIARILAGLDIL